MIKIVCRQATDARHGISSDWINVFIETQQRLLTKCIYNLHYSCLQRDANSDVARKTYELDNIVEIPIRYD